MDVVRHPFSQQRPDSHAGRGPRGYQRSDARLLEAVCMRLAADPQLWSGDIEVHVESGIATLTGQVGSRAEKWLAEDLAAAVPGVQEVTNRIGVRRGAVELAAYEVESVAAVWFEPQAGMGDPFAAGRSAGRHAGRGPRAYRRSDDRLCDDVVRALTADPHVDATDIEVDVEDGVVTLRGQVGSRAERRRAEETAEAQPGVEAVQMQLGVREMRHAGTPAATSVRPDMRVVGADGGEIGRVKDLAGDQVLVDRPWRRDLFVPLEACRVVDGDRVVLNVAADQVGDTGWSSPPYRGGESGGGISRI